VHGVGPRRQVGGLQVELVAQGLGAVGGHDEVDRDAEAVERLQQPDPVDRAGGAADAEHQAGRHRPPRAVAGGRHSFVPCSLARLAQISRCSALNRSST
jgi:hypothetical protein